MEEYKGTILVVDDEEPIRELLRRKLSGDGFYCESAADGKDALWKAFVKDFDIVLLDIKMPGMSGIDVLSKMVTDHPETCVVMITAVADSQTAVDAMKLGAYDYITKPWNFEDLNIRIKRALERRKLMLENREYQRNLEVKVKEKTEQVHSLLAQKDQFIAQLAHDLKTPLTPIITLLPLLRQRTKDSKAIEMLEIMTKNVNYIKELVFKTLELARLGVASGRMTLNDTRLSHVVTKVLEARKPVFELKRILVENRVSDDIVVKADSIMLQEALDNIISNAAKFTTEEGTVTIDANRDSDSVVVIRVKDTGIGMTKDQLGQIFVEFYKADNSRHDLTSTGLGLSICKRIIEKHGGRIWAESDGLGKGSTILFTLPAGSEAKTMQEVS
jgi:signal transduction histidine kinase